MTDAQKQLAEKYGTPAQAANLLAKLSPLIEHSDRKANIALASYEAEWSKAGKEKPESWLSTPERMLISNLGKRGWAVAAIPPAKLCGLDRGAVAREMAEHGLNMARLVGGSDQHYSRVSRSVEIDKLRDDAKAAMELKQDADLIASVAETKQDAALEAKQKYFARTVRGILLTVTEDGRSNYQVVEDIPARSPFPYVERLLGENITYGLLMRPRAGEGFEEVAQLAHSPDCMIKTRGDLLTNSLASSLVRAFTRDGRPSSARSAKVDYCIGDALILGPTAPRPSDTGVIVDEQLDVPDYIIDMVKSLHAALFAE